MPAQTLNPPAYDHFPPRTDNQTTENGDSFKQAIDKANANFAQLFGQNGVGMVDFGAAPGASDAQLVITGQTGITAGATVDAWLVAVATADHSIDEHWLDPPRIVAGNIVPGVGFTIYAVNEDIGDVLTYGKWSVAWQWIN
jgi:hypothetical protein